MVEHCLVVVLVGGEIAVDRVVTRRRDGERRLLQRLQGEGGGVRGGGRGDVEISRGPPVLNHDIHTYSGTTPPSLGHS